MFGVVPFLPLFLGGEQDTSHLFGVLSSSTRSKYRWLPPFIILSKNITLRLPHQGRWMCRWRSSAQSDRGTRGASWGPCRWGLTPPDALLTPEETEGETMLAMWEKAWQVGCVGVEQHSSLSGKAYCVGSPVDYTGFDSWKQQVSLSLWVSRPGAAGWVARSSGCVSHCAALPWGREEGPGTAVTSSDRY